MFSDPVVQPPLSACPFSAGFPDAPTPFPLPLAATRTASVPPTAPCVAPTPSAVPRAAPVPPPVCGPNTLYCAACDPGPAASRAAPTLVRATLSRCRCTDVVRCRHRFLQTRPRRDPRGMRTLCASSSAAQPLRLHRQLSCRACSVPLADYSSGPSPYSSQGDSAGGWSSSACHFLRH
jgi:hypothetical protein